MPEHTQAELKRIWDTIEKVENPDRKTSTAVNYSQKNLQRIWDSLPGAPAQPASQYGDVPYEGFQQQQPQPQKPSPSIGQELVGAGETGLTAFSGATSGMAGMGVGTLEGLYKAIRSGKYGTQQGADIVEQQALKRAGQLTYAPRTQTGQRNVNYLGKVAENLSALGPLAAPSAEFAAAGMAARRAANVLSRPRATAAHAPSGPAIDPQISDAGIAPLIQKAASGQKKAQGQIAGMSEPNQEVVQAAQRLGIYEYLQPDHITTNQQYRQISALAKKIPGSKTRQAEVEGLEQVARRADRIISELGGTDDFSTLSSTVKQSLQDAQKALDDKVVAGFKVVNDAIDPTFKTGTSNIEKYFATRIKELGGKQYLSPIERDVYNKIMVGKEGQPNYALVDEVRKDLTQARVMKGKDIYKNAPKYRINAIERPLLEDQRKAAATHGVVDDFDLARESTALRKSVENDITALFGKQLDANFVTKLATGIKQISSGDASKLEKIIDKIPKDLRQEVVASSLSTALGKTARRNEISFANYANWYENATRNKDAFEVVAKYLPPDGKRLLKDLYLVSDGIRKAQLEAITTGRGEALLHSIDNSERFIVKLADMARLGAKSAAAEVASSAAGVHGGGALWAILKLGLRREKTRPSVAFDDLLASREFRSAVNDKVRTGTVNIETLQKLSRSKVFTRFAKSVGIRNPMQFLVAEMAGGKAGQNYLMSDTNIAEPNPTTRQ